MGRDVAQVVSSFADDEYVYRYTRYDRQGRAFMQSVPSKEVTATHWHTTDFDTLGRVIRTTAADGTETSVSYGDLRTTTTVSSAHKGYVINQQQVEVFNIAGDTLSMTDADNGVIQYQYDATGNLSQVTGADGSVIVTTFDDYGRKTAMNDPDKGVWQYQYNALGSLTRQTDAKGQQTVSVFDSLGRQQSRQDKAADGTVLQTTRWTYGDEVLTEGVATAGTLGQLVKETIDGGPTKTQTYDHLGRVISTQISIDGQQWDTTTEYDAYGRLLNQWDASGSGRGLHYTYQNGYLNTLSETEADNATVYYDVEQMNAFGKVTQFKAGNALTTSNGYNQATGLLESTITGSTTSQVHERMFRFDGMGNLRARHTGPGGQSSQETFTYDALNRLTSVDFTTGDTTLETLSLSYDASGNILIKSDIAAGQSWTYGTKASQCSASAVTAGPHAVTQTGQTHYCYDANGNQTHRYDGTVLTRSIDYTSFDKASLITSETQTSAFHYDGSRARYKRVDTVDGQATTTWYVGNLEIKVKPDGSTETRRYIADIAIQSITASGQQTSYLYKDHLGSTEVITDSGGTITECMSFGAFGNRRAANCGSTASAFTALTLTNLLAITDRGFTGHEMVDHAGIIHMNGRIYDSQLGRFLQADPFIQAPKNSQSYNRYSYVLNNPLSYTDPSGYLFKALGKGLRNIVRGIANIPVLNKVVKAVLTIYCQACLVAWNAATAYATTGSLFASFRAAASTWVEQKYDIDLSYSGVTGMRKFGSNDQVKALRGGVYYSLQNGSFGHGTMPVSSGLDRTILMHDRAVSTTTGGKFVNGVNTSSFKYSLNRLLRDAKNRAETKIKSIIPNKVIDFSSESEWKASNVDPSSIAVSMSDWRSIGRIETSIWGAFKGIVVFKFAKLTGAEIKIGAVPFTVIVGAATENLYVQEQIITYSANVSDWNGRVHYNLFGGVETVEFSGLSNTRTEVLEVTRQFRIMADQQILYISDPEILSVATVADYLSRSNGFPTHNVHK